MNSLPENKCSEYIPKLEEFKKNQILDFNIVQNLIFHIF
jgi:hypothetical protein